MRKSFSEQEKMMRRTEYELQEKTKKLEQEQNNNALMRMDFSTKLNQQKEIAEAREQEMLMWRDKYLQMVQKYEDLTTKFMDSQKESWVIFECQDRAKLGWLSPYAQIFIPIIITLFEELLFLSLLR